MNWTPIGSPPALQWSGTDIAGTPAQFAIAEKGENSRTLSAKYAAFGPECTISPSRTGGCASIGVRITSHRSWNAASSLVARCTVALGAALDIPLLPALRRDFRTAAMTVLKPRMTVA